MKPMSITDSLCSSRIISGDDAHAFRDPAVIYKDGVFRLYCTYTEVEETGDVYMYTVLLRSRDLVHWSKPEKLTPRDKALNYSSPGNIVEHDDRYVMCLQTYPRNNGEKYGNEQARIFTMTSYDLDRWDAPQLIPVKGEIPLSEMGRMIDPYLVWDEKSGVWNCFYKQNGISYSVSRDLVHWEYSGNISGGENVCVIQKDGRYYMFHSPDNGVGIKVSEDLVHWEDTGTVLTFGQSVWPWAKGRITAGFVLPYEEDGRTLYLLFFHGSGPEDESIYFDTHASIGLAWSSDLCHWEWLPDSWGQNHT